MGLFANLLPSETRVTVGTTVSRVVADKLIVSSTRTGLVAGLLGSPNNQLVENILDSVTKGIGVRAERMYSYAKTNYPLGLPVGKVSQASDGKEVVLSVLRGLTHPGIEEIYYHVGPLNVLHMGWHALTNLYNYDSITNTIGTLTAQKGYPVYLTDMVVVIPEEDLPARSIESLEQWGTAPNAGVSPERKTVDSAFSALRSAALLRTDPDATVDSVEVQYAWVVPTEFEVEPARTTLVEGVPRVTPAIKVTRDVIHKDTLSINITGYAPEQDYFQIKYKLPEESAFVTLSKDAYWVYQMGSGTYPEIDAIFDHAPDLPGEFFPFIYLRQGLTSMRDKEGSPAYVASEKMFKTLGLDYGGTIDSIQQNPDIDKIEQALMMFAVPANTTNQVEQKYLFDFFTRLYLATGGITIGSDWQVSEEMVTNEYGSDSGMEIAELLRLSVPSRINIGIKDKQLSTSLACKSIFKQKKAGVIAAVGKYASSFRTEQVNFKYSKKVYTPNTVPTVETITQPIDVFVYQKQITKHVYEEVVVYDLQMTYYMWGGYSTVGDDLDTILLIPIDRGITKRYGLKDREELYTRSLHYVFNSRTVQDVKWYQGAFFSGLIQFAGIVLTVYTLGSDGGLISKALQVVAGTLTMNAFVAAIVSSVVEYVKLYVATSLFVKAVGEEFAIDVALVLAAYSIGKGIQAGSIKGLPMVSELLAVSNGLVARVSESYAAALKGLKREAEEFNALYNEKLTELDKANKLLDTSPILQPSDLLRLSPTELFATVHYGNIGALGIDSVSSYVSNTLTLPSFNETIGRN